VNIQSKPIIRIGNELIEIYALVDPRNQTIKYIGSAQDAKKRYVDHTGIARSYKHSTISRVGPLYHWILELWENNHKPELYLIEAVNPTQRIIREKYWIELLGLDNLLNRNINKSKEGICNYDCKMSEIIGGDDE
jgi:hypothetical protein